MLLNHTLHTAALAAGFVLAVASQELQPQTDTFNSTFALSKEQIASVNISQALADSVNVATQFERSNWATGSVVMDPFYTDLPVNASSAPAGSILKVEVFTNTSTYTIAPTLALSRIIYQSKTLNGTLVPASAFILWPFHPRNGAKVAPMVTWGHGTSGIYSECGPSHIRNLWYAYSGPYALALAGYAVVGVDFAGLGVPFYSDGSHITHQYVASPAAGNDMLYAAMAAYSAFPDKLTKEFVVMGHSQGGGAAWGAAQQQLQIKAPGYLGAIAASPVTDAIQLSFLLGSSLGLLQVAPALLSVYKDLPLSSILTSEGIQVLNLMEDIRGCNSAFQTLVGGILAADPTTALTQDAFLNSTYAKSWEELTVAGGKDFAGPMLVIQGLMDGTVPPALTTQFVNKTCTNFPRRDLHYLTVSGVDHVPVMYATQQIWLDWLDDRFASGSQKRGDKCSGKCTYQTLGSTASQPLDQYTSNLNYFLELALDAYEVA